MRDGEGLGWGSSERRSRPTPDPIGYRIVVATQDRDRGIRHGDRHHPAAGRSTHPDEAVRGVPARAGRLGRPGQQPVDPHHPGPAEGQRRRSSDVHPATRRPEARDRGLCLRARPGRPASRPRHPPPNRARADRLRFPAPDHLPRRVLWPAGLAVDHAGEGQARPGRRGRVHAAEVRGPDPAPPVDHLLAPGGGDTRAGHGAGPTRQGLRPRQGHEKVLRRLQDTARRVRGVHRGVAARGGAVRVRRADAQPADVRLFHPEEELPRWRPIVSGEPAPARIVRRAPGQRSRSRLSLVLPPVPPAAVP